MKQLFIDDFIIDSQQNLIKVSHQPERYSGNPIIVGDRPWEKWQASVDGRPVVYDEQTKLFKMYYVSTLKDPSAPTSYRYKTCYAISEDGIHWTKPNLSQVEWEGSRKNNILKWGANWMRRPNVIKDSHDPDPSRRFKMIYADVVGGKFAIAKALSPDGVHWRSDGKPWFWAHHNSNLLGWDPRVGRYVIYTRMPGHPNRVGRSTSADFVTWTEPETVLAPEPSEAGIHFKGNAAFLYEDVYIGWLWIYDRHRKLDAELVFSRDGIKWQRVFPGKFIFPRGQPGTWDREGILANAPVVYRDKLWIYYSGWNLRYGDRKIMDLSEAGLIENGQRIQNAIGVAMLRLDGFVSLDAGKQQGVLTTRTLELPGGPLIVNADVRGELRVEILDEKGQPVSGYAAGDSLPIRSDGLRHTIRWGRKASLAKLRGKAVKLRFLIRDGSLYAFGFNPLLKTIPS